MEESFISRIMVVSLVGVAVFNAFVKMTVSALRASYPELHE
jgi:hypothetical protein